VSLDSDCPHTRFSSVSCRSPEGSSRGMAAFAFLFAENTCASASSRSSNISPMRVELVLRIAGKFD
jgi:hypothetical protein